MAQRIGLLIVAVVGAATVAFIPSHAEAAVNPYSVKLGLVPGENRNSATTTAFAGMKDVGASWVRLDVSWKDIEPVRGKRLWAATDKAVTNARAKGLNILGLVTYTPTWAFHPGCTQSPCAPAVDKYDEFAAFAAAAAKRYKGRISAWEVWNEPNERNFWKPKVDPAAYVKLLNLTYASIHRVDPTLKVVSGGLSCHSTDTQAYLTWRTFMQRFYAAGGAKFDVFGIHPHFASNAPLYPSADNPFYNLPKTHQFLASHGDGAKKIWLTEFGYETGGLTPTQQGKRLQTALGQVVKWSFVERMFVFAWMDFGGHARPQTWGLNDADGHAKVSRSMLRSYVRSHA